MRPPRTLTTLQRDLERALAGGQPLRLDDAVGPGGDRAAGPARISADRTAAPGVHNPAQETFPPPQGTALVVPTSGSSSGTGRPVALSGVALTHSAEATHSRLGGPGQWLLALPAEHIAGLQVLIRSILAGTEPAVLTGDGFSGPALADAIGRMRPDVRRYVSLVPTQLHRVLRASADVVEAVAGLDAVLLGGAACPPHLLAEATEAGIRVVASYGMTETCGGCVYDGRPLRDVQIQLQPDGRILLAGPVLASGYLDDGPSPFTELDGQRWLRTSDAGSFTDGRLQVLGRIDDVIVTGGVNVHPAPIEEALGLLPGVGEVAVLGSPDTEWGQLVTAVVVPAPGGPVVDLGRVREHLGGGPRAPRVLVLCEALPRRGPGKVDPVALRMAVQRAMADGAAQRLPG